MRSGKLLHDLNLLRKSFISQQNDSEAEEERLVNGMMKRLDCVKKEKEQMIIGFGFGREEAMISKFGKH